MLPGTTRHYIRAVTEMPISAIPTLPIFWYRLYLENRGCCLIKSLFCLSKPFVENPSTLGW